MEKAYKTSETIGGQLTEQKKLIFKNIDTNDLTAVKEAMQQYKTALQKSLDQILESSDGIETSLTHYIEKRIKNLNNHSHSDKARQNYVKENQTNQSDTEYTRYSRLHAGEYGRANARVYGTDSENQQERNNARSTQRRLNQEIEETVASFDRETVAAMDSAEAIKQFNQNAEESSQGILKLGNSTMQYSDIIVNVAQGATSFAFALSSIKSIGTTWADENIGVGEKLLQTFMSIGMAVPMLVGGLKNMTTTLKSYEQIIERVQAKKAVFNVLETASINLNKQEAAAIGGKITAMTAEQLAEKTGLTLDEAKLTLGQARMQHFMLEKAARKENLSAMATEVIAKK